MEIIILRNTLRALKKQRENYEANLKKFGIEKNKAPLDIQDMLHSYAKLQQKTQLADLNPIYQMQFLHMRQLASRSNVMRKKRLLNRVREQEQAIEKHSQERDLMIRFVGEIEQRTAKKDDLIKETAALKKQVEQLSLKKPELPDDINLDKIVRTAGKIAEEKKQARLNRSKRMAK